MKTLRFKRDLNEIVGGLCHFSSQYLVRIQWDVKWDFDLGSLLRSHDKHTYLSGRITQSRTWKHIELSVTRTLFNIDFFVVKYHFAQSNKPIQKKNLKQDYSTSVDFN